MKRTIEYLLRGFLLMLCFGFISCEDFLEVESPEHKIVSEAVFDNEETATSAMKGIYNELFRADFSRGWENSVTVLSGLSADNLKAIRTNDLSLQEFFENNIQPNNERNLSLWSSAYSIIYMTNSLLEGIEASQGLDGGVKNRLEGEAKFVRAFTYFYLTNLYENVPLILSTDYRENSVAESNLQETIYDQIISDLKDSRNLLGTTYDAGERTQINSYVASALLARVHLYRENWEEAESESSEVIDNSDQYKILDDLNQVFLANSKEAIWQLTPEGRGGPLGFTNEGSVFLFLSFAPSLTKVALTDELIYSFEDDDLRLSNWIGLNESTGHYFPFKYKDRRSFNEILEYSMVLRLAEQYLIRAEARLMQGNLEGAMQDIDVIRERAGLPLLSESDVLIDNEELLDIILEERRRELFAEWGHRWLDLKRKGKASEFLSSISPDWQNTDVLYPVPAQERMKNPNLDQNTGY